MKKFVGTALALGLLTSVSSTAVAVDIHVNAGDFNITTARSYSSQYSGRYTNEAAANSLKEAARGVAALDGAALDAAVGEPIHNRLQNQLGRWYANVKYSKDTIQRSAWVKDDPAVRNAWSQGYDGTGVNIAINDQFHGRNEYNIAGNTGHHGDHVENILVGQDDWGTVGIAPEARVVARGDVPLSEYRPAQAPAEPYRTEMVRRTWLSSTPPPSSWNEWAEVRRRNHGQHQRGMRWDNVDIVSSSVAYSHDRVKRDVNSHTASDDAFGTVIVQTAGNGGLSNYYGDNVVATTSETNIPSWGITTNINHISQLYASDYKDSLLIVGTLEHDGLNSGLHAGAHADRYVVDTPTGGGYGGATSWVTPKVAGKVALIKNKFNNLNAEEVTDIVLRTADDLGAPGVDPIYGAGKINLGRALSPVGSIR